MAFGMMGLYCLCNVSEKRFTMLVSSRPSPGWSLGIVVHQTPSELIRKAGESAEFVCTHGETEYRVMLWYRQSTGQRDLRLIGRMDYSNIYVESAFEEDCSLSGDLSGGATKIGSLRVQLKDPESSGIYYCAARLARRHTPATPLDKNTAQFTSRPRWFGMKSSQQAHVARPPVLGVALRFSKPHIVDYSGARNSP